MMRWVLVALVVLLYASVGQSVSAAGDSPAGGSIVGYSLRGRSLTADWNPIVASTGIPLCSLANTAPDAWNFNTRTSDLPVAPTQGYEHKGTETTMGRDMFCDHATIGPECPFIVGGPGGTNAVRFNNSAVASTPSYGLWAEDRAHNNYSLSGSNAMTITFFFKAPSGFFGFDGSGVIQKFGEFFMGENPGLATADKVCFDVTTAGDAGGSGCTNPSCCGSNALGANNMLGVTSNQTDHVNDQEWHRFAAVWDGDSDDPVVGDGSYFFYVDGVLEKTENGISGEMPDTAGQFQVGSARTKALWDIGNFSIDDLQVWAEAKNGAWIATNTNCKVPD